MFRKLAVFNLGDFVCSSFALGYGIFEIVVLLDGLKFYSFYDCSFDHLLNGNQLFFINSGHLFQ